MLVTQKNGTACLTFTPPVVATVIIHLTNPPSLTSDANCYKSTKHSSAGEPRWQTPFENPASEKGPEGLPLFNVQSPLAKNLFRGEMGCGTSTVMLRPQRNR